MSVVSPSDKPRALITGFGGFTAHYLAAELEAAGYEVFGTTLVPASASKRVFLVDLCDRNALQAVVQRVQPNVIAHLAAISFVAHDDVDAIYRINIVGTRNLLQALTRLEKAPRAVLLASSANIYGNVAVAIIDESIAPAPANDYAVSKLAMEHMARLWMDRLPIMITRPFNYTGVSQGLQFLLPKIVDHFKRRASEIELGNIDIARDFSDVRDVAVAYRRLIELAPAGEVFNVCSGISTSLKSILSGMAEIAGYEIDVKINPAFVRTGDIKSLCGNGTKLRQLTGLAPTRPLHDTLRWMYANN